MNKRSALFLTPLLLLLLPFSIASQHVLIAGQDFDTIVTPAWTYTSNGLTYINGLSASNDAPSNSPWGIGGSWAWETTATADTMIFSNLSLVNHDSVYITFRLAGFSLSTISNGPDQLDQVRVWVSVNGGTTWYSSIEVHGFNNATWSYAAGTGMALDTLQLNNNTNIYEPTAGGPQTTEGYSTVKIFIPDAYNQVMIRIRSRESTAQERWCIDNVEAWGIPIVTGMNEMGDALFTIYPNPSDGSVFISNPGEESTIKILGVKGDMVTVLKMNSNETKMLMLSAGIYIVERTGPEGTFYQKLIIR
ncbi:MAG: T9SS type A sorting domain-containing protein [Bacteroidia bacterium]|nr:T9SS type A sorting domain-containing protein [Bacteroidia bacterium]